MTRLVIQIPCLNEEETLPQTLAELPTELPGVDEIKVLVIDDGSSDATAEIARRAGADVVSHRRPRGLARAFTTALRESLARGADIIVQTDGDNQYPGATIASLVAPIVAGEADIVVGDRQPGKLDHFSPVKRLLQRLGSWTVGRFAGSDVPDAASGFRAFTRDAASRVRVFTGFSATMETLIQAGREGMSIHFVPIEVNETRRPSRLHRGNLHYVMRQAITIARAYAYYEPLWTFGLLGLPFLLSGLALEVRFFFYYLTGQGGIARWVNSVTIGGFLITLGVLFWALGLLADALLANRRLSRDILLRLQKLEDRLLEDGVLEDRSRKEAGVSAQPHQPAAAGHQQIAGEGHGAEGESH